MSIAGRLRKAAAAAVRLERARSDWDFKTFDQTARVLDEAVGAIPGEWKQFFGDANAEMERNREILGSPLYRERIEKALREAGLPFEGTLPVYEVAPFTMEIAADDGSVRLRFGRRVEKYSAFAPESVAVWVRKCHSAVVKRKFNADRFWKDLLGAYKVGNRLAFKSDDVKWGKTVSLKQIYELLTIRKNARRDYPESHYVYDLVRMRESGLSRDGLDLEFGFSKEQARAYLLRDSQGKESRFSSLSIHRQEG